MNQKSSQGQYLHAGLSLLQKHKRPGKDGQAFVQYGGS